MLDFANGKGPSQLRASLPMAPTEFRIDFFPEGGDLIAGLPNRVFYRVRSKSGEPITGDGRVWLLAGKNGIPQADSSYELGMGYLRFRSRSQGNLHRLHLDTRQDRKHRESLRQARHPPMKAS